MITTARAAQRRLHYRYELPSLLTAEKLWNRRNARRKRRDRDERGDRR